MPPEPDPSVWLLPGAPAIHGAEETRQLLAAAVTSVAPRLLGAYLVAGPVAIRITEVEAYGGADDPASHAFAGRRPRHESMYHRAGTSYVYLSHGLHHCLNVVTGRAGEPAAVLLRAGEVVTGHRWAHRRRGVARKGPVPHRDLARGPGALGQALGVEIAHDGRDLLRDADLRLLVPMSPLVASRLAPDVTPRLCTGGPPGSDPVVCRGPRVGVSGAGADPATYSWRYWLAEDETVSRFRAGARRGRSREPDRRDGGG